ncbi:uncharacterized protein DI49_3877 [Saccharomyces eubayanus]|uniref:uncharacterized protein n=1 Tax=Saccharomyces eubayanus TaxID=1080349 RepID=UPI0006C64173|nr:hypothetical protein DI49_3877 [Saccharomyces eubayanus]KOG98049.1 hypothetical protein DI49_3877 [Saccharomyces eubayanus]
MSSSKQPARWEAQPRKPGARASASRPGDTSNSIHPSGGPVPGALLASNAPGPCGRPELHGPGALKCKLDQLLLRERRHDSFSNGLASLLTRKFKKNKERDRKGIKAKAKIAKLANAHYLFGCLVICLFACLFVASSPLHIITNRRVYRHIYTDINLTITVVSWALCRLFIYNIVIYLYVQHSYIYIRQSTLHHR